MKTATVSFASFLLVLVRALPTPNPALSTNGTELFIATWAITAYSNGGCSGTLILTTGGNTPTGCNNLDQQANSYRFISDTDPQTNVSFQARLFSSMNCIGLVVTDPGKSGSTCKTVPFESWEIDATN
jgi:hypothetical protein